MPQPADAPVKSRAQRMFGKRIASLRDLPRTYPRIFSEASWALFGQICSAVGMLAGVRLVTEYVQTDLYGTLNLLAGLVALGKNTFQAPLLQAQLRFYGDAAVADRVPLFRRTIARVLARRSE